MNPRFDNTNTYETYLPDEFAADLWVILFALQANNKRFAEALSTYNIIQTVDEGKVTDTLTASVAEITALRANDVAYIIAAKTNEHGS